MRLLVQQGGLLAAAAMILAVCYRATRRFYRLEYYRSMISRYLQKWGTPYHVSQEHLRDAFTSVPTISLKPAKLHTHAQAACGRSEGTATIKAICSALGKKPFSIQMSTNDQRKGNPGSRAYYWTKDLTTAVVDAVPGHEHISVLVDTDHYIDMPDLLLSDFRPVIIRTLQPTQVARIGTDYSYRFMEDGNVDYNVCGGGSFNHPIWNWQQDHLKVFDWGPSGLWPRCNTYLVERRANCEDHELVLLAPLLSFSGFAAVLAYWYLFGKPLVRLDVRDGEFAALETRRLNAQHISVGRLGSFVQVTLPTIQMEGVFETAKTLKNDITMPSVEGQVGKTLDDNEVKAASALLTQYARRRVGVKRPMVFPVADAVRNYQYGKFEPEAKPSLEAFMAPLIHGAYAPMKSKGNEQRMVDSRIVNLQKDKNSIPSPFLLQVMEEFVERLVPEAGTLVPEDLDYLMEHQDSPAQRMILNQATGMILEQCAKVASFMKAEAYGSPNDPRPISTIGPLLKHDYSEYIYTFSKAVLTQRPWYAFSKTPRQVAERVVSICGASTQAAMTDFSRYDGNMDACARMLEKSILLRAFHPRYTNNVLELHRITFNLKARGTFGTKYNTGFARNSGVPDTSAFNTTINAFVNFLALRKTRVGGDYMGADDAWNHLEKYGLFGGDDGLMGEAPGTLPDAATILGHNLELATIKRGETGVTFLARLYGPDVWYGDPASCCDIYRQVSKFHVTPNLPETVKPEQKLAEKARSFFLTDANSPVIGELAKVCKDLAPTGKATNKLRRWGDDHDVEDQYPNPPRDFYVEIVMSDERMASFDWEIFGEYISRVQKDPSPKVALNPPLCLEISNHLPKITAVVEEEVMALTEPVVTVQRKRRGNRGKGKA